MTRLVRNPEGPRVFHLLGPGSATAFSELTATGSRRGGHQALDRRCEVTAPIVPLHHRPHTIEIIIWDDEFVQWSLREDGSVDFEDYIYVAWACEDLESTHTAEEAEAILSRYHFDGSVEVKEAAFAAAEALVAAALRGDNVAGVVLSVDRRCAGAFPRGPPSNTKYERPTRRSSARATPLGLFGSITRRDVPFPVGKLVAHDCRRAGSVSSVVHERHLASGFRT